MHTLFTDTRRLLTPDQYSMFCTESVNCSSGRPSRAIRCAKQKIALPRRMTGICTIHVGGRTGRKLPASRSCRIEKIRGGYQPKPGALQKNEAGFLPNDRLRKHSVGGGVCFAIWNGGFHFRGNKFAPRNQESTLIRPLRDGRRPSCGRILLVSNRDTACPSGWRRAGGCIAAQ